MNKMICSCCGKELVTDEEKKAMCHRECWNDPDSCIGMDEIYKIIETEKMNLRIVQLTIDLLKLDMVSGHITFEIDDKYSITTHIHIEYKKIKKVSK